MGKKITISSLALFISAVAIASGFRSSKPRQMLLRDGFVLTGVDGRLVIHDSNENSRESSFDRWSFEFDSNVSGGRGLIKAGTRLELLPSSVLERMIADANKDSNASPVRSKTSETTTIPSKQISNGASYRLWGRVTRYRGKNFIFPISAAILGLVVSGLVGLVFGIYPARQAAKKSPMEALRYE